THMLPASRSFSILGKALLGSSSSPAILDDFSDFFYEFGNILIVRGPKMWPSSHPTTTALGKAEFKQVHQHVAAPIPNKTPHSPRLIAVGLHKSTTVLAGTFGSGPLYFLEDLIGHLVHLLFDCLGY